MGKIYRVTPSHPTFNAMIYGDPGSGKTTLAATAQDCPEMADVLFANIEGGLLSIAHRGDIHAEKIRTTEDVNKLFWRFVKKEDELSTYRTVVIDSMTELQTINLEEIVKSAMEGGKARSRSGKERTENDIWQEDYGQSTTALKRIVRGFKDLRVNVIVTALAKYVYPKVAEKADKTDVDPIAVMPSLTAKLGESVMGYMDFVWYTFYDQEEDKYKLLTKSQGAYRAKTRGPRFQEAVGPIIIAPNMATIYDTFVKATSGESVIQTRPAKKKRSA